MADPPGVEDVIAVHRPSVIGSCCGNEAWRGHLCQYHEGYMDGYEAGIRAGRKAAQDDGPVERENS